MKKVFIFISLALIIPSIGFAGKGGNKPSPNTDLETAVEETKIELCNLYNIVGVPLPAICLDFCGDATQDLFEECDDGNIESGDGCAADCTIEKIDCGPVSSPTNGFVFYDSSTEGSVAIYSCDTGYTLTGDPERTCQADGQWSGAAPICEEQDSCANIDCSFLDTQCQMGICINGDCIISNKPNETPCTDGENCTLNDICTDGVCAGEWDNETCPL